MELQRGRPIEILLIEDNPGDVRLTEEALREGRVANRLHVVTNGVDGLAFLRREGKYNGAIRPDLVLLDLNLPRMDGRAVLREIKGDDGLRAIPVVVLTTSSADADVLASYDLHANCYITKPVDLPQFLSAISAIEDFWLSVVTLPPAGPGD